MRSNLALLLVVAWAAWRWRRAEASRPRTMPGPATAGPVPGAAARRAPGAAARELMAVLTRAPQRSRRRAASTRPRCAAGSGAAPRTPFRFSTATRTPACRAVKLGCMLDLEVPDSNQTTTDMAACARDANNASCADLLANVFPASCRIKPGNRLNGERCGSSWQCMSTHCEKTTATAACARRAPPPAARARVDGGCTLGLVCAAQKCVAPAAMGAPCSAIAPCRANLYCSAISNTCATPLALGAPCGGDSSGVRLPAGCFVQHLRRDGEAEVRDRRRRERRPGVRHRQQHADPLCREQRPVRASR